MSSIKRLFFVLSFSLCFLNTTCDDDDLVITDCDQTTVISENLYNSLESANFTIIDAYIIDDCLTIEIGASGCDGNTWEFNLVDSGAVAESLPEQRYLKFQLINTELCDAYFEKTIAFDVTPLRIDNGVDKVILHIEGLESSLSYSY